MATHTLDRRVLLVAAVAAFAVVFALFVTVEHSGIGVAHGYYVAIILAALALGTIGGAVAALAATGLYLLGVLVNPRVPMHDIASLATAIRGAAYLAVGTVVGWHSQRNRVLAERLELLAERDRLTGLPNTRAFESAIDARLARDEPFVLVVGDMDGLAALNGDRGYEQGDDALRRVAELLTVALPPDADVCRVGGDEFAVLVDGSEAAAVATELERRVRGESCRLTVGWASYPEEGPTALALYRAADERLYLRKVVRRGHLAAA